MGGLKNSLYIKTMFLPLLHLLDLPRAPPEATADREKKRPMEMERQEVVSSLETKSPTADAGNLRVAIGFSVEVASGSM